MKMESVVLDNGEIQVRITGSREEFAELSEEEEVGELDPNAVSSVSPQLGDALRGGLKLRNPFKNKTYCVRCENGTKHTIHARGRLAAVARAATICNPYQLDKGACRD